MYSLGQWSDQRYYVIKHVLSDLRGQPLPRGEGEYFALMLILDAVDVASCLLPNIANIETPCYLVFVSEIAASYLLTI